MIKEIYYRIRYKRIPYVSSSVLEDISRYLEMHSRMSADLDATVELHDASVLTDERNRDIESLRSPSPKADVYPDMHIEQYAGDEDLLPKEASSVSERFIEYQVAPPPQSKHIGIPTPSFQMSGGRADKAKNELDEIISGLGMTFQQTLLNLIDRKGYTDSQVYRKANLDRKLFSKIRCNKDYKPSKATALSLAVALGLSYDEATDLLGRAGLAFSPSSTSDMIVKYCITHQIYDIYEVNAILYAYDQQLLGC